MNLASVFAHFKKIEGSLNALSYAIVKYNNGVKQRLFL